jgi:hypothetical protein
MTGYNRSGFRVERLKVDLEPEPWDVFLNEYFRLNIHLKLFNPFSGAKETTDGIFSKPGQRIAMGELLRADSVGIFHGVQHSDAV